MIGWLDHHSTPVQLAVCMIVLWIVFNIAVVLISLYRDTKPRPVGPPINHSTSIECVVSNGVKWHSYFEDDDLNRLLQYIRRQYPDAAVGEVIAPGSEFGTCFVWSAAFGSHLSEGHESPRSALIAARLAIEPPNMGNVPPPPMYRC